MSRIIQYLKAVLILLLFQYLDSESALVVPQLETSNPSTPSYVHGVVDRIEDNGRVVILVEKLKREIVILREDYQDTALLKPNTWVTVHLEGDMITKLKIDKRRTQKESEQVKAIFERVRERLNNNILLHLY
ncbi:DUF3006 family protein [Ornithinibacillus scapharcae]|uniref:DUF3006 family protein n=1 Tax=Ornithinibacillus scapharcae TaxID=1147159 RepID=UPI000225AABD|nr:DUF3006 family protein [Ornithinibacillus scapharcae]